MPATAPESRSARRRLRNWLLSATLLLAAGLVATGMAEILVRLVAPQQLVQIRPDIWQPDDSLGWVNRPDVRTTINTGERTVTLITDADGMRVGTGGRLDAATNILLIGDSFMQALQVDHEQSFAALLEEALSARAGGPVAVWNAGVDGWDPPQYLLRTRQLLARRRFDLVVVALYLGNDVVERRVERVPARAPVVRHRFRMPRGPSWSDVVQGLFYPVNDALEVRSHLFILLKQALHPLLIKADLTAEYFPVGLRRSEARSGRWALTADICRDLDASAREAGAATVFVLIPEPFAVDPDELDLVRRGFGVDSAEVDVDQPTRLLSLALEERRLDFVAALGAFRSARAAGPLYGKVDRHLTPEGHAALAALVAPAVERALAVRPPRRTR